MNGDCRIVTAEILHIYRETAELPMAVEIPERQEVIMVRFMQCKLRCLDCGNIWVQRLPFRVLTT